MTRVMFDSTSINDIPTTAQMVGYYVDGIYAVSEATVRARFPHAVLVGISAVGTDAGIVGDVEPGCMTVAQGVLWVKFRRAANADPTIYCNEMNAWAGIRQAFKNAGVAEPHYWVADYDNVPTLPAGAVAKQYANPTLTGGHYDKSIVADIWPGVDSGASDMTPDEHLYLYVMTWRIAVLSGQVTVAQVPAEFQAYVKGVVSIPDMKTELDALKTAVAAIPAGPPGLAGTNGKDGATGPAGTVPDHSHIVATTGTEIKV